MLQPGDGSGAPGLLGFPHPSAASHRWAGAGGEMRWGTAAKPPVTPSICLGTGGCGRRGGVSRSGARAASALSLCERRAPGSSAGISSFPWCQQGGCLLWGFLTELFPSAWTCRSPRPWSWAASAGDPSQHCHPPPPPQPSPRCPSPAFAAFQRSSARPGLCRRLAPNRQR